jgi:3-deoxy-manno-octulosonate cytidylyltransferase (CMP-KDO synthetase)
MKAIAIIPARYASTRLPGKPLALLAGKPMVLHVVERARRAASIERVVVATDDQRILEAVRAFGAEALMTRADHRSGTERIAEVAAQLRGEVFVNVQGDEPLLAPEAIDAAVEALESAGDAAAVSTLCVPIRRAADILDPNVVKVVRDFDGLALYFSRAPIPWVRDVAPPAEGAAPAFPAGRHLKHLGLYVYRREALLEFPALPPGDLERLEQLEQLRFLENGYRIFVAETQHDSVSVDVPEDIPRVESLLRT